VGESGEASGDGLRGKWKQQLSPGVDSGARRGVESIPGKRESFYTGNTTGSCLHNLGRVFLRFYFMTHFNLIEQR